MSKNTSFNKTKILTKVTQLFYTKGYCATSMQEIVEVSHLNRSSLYNTFGSKLELFIECFYTCETKYRRDIQKIMMASTNPLKTIREILELSINESINGYLIPNYISETKNKEPQILKLIKNQQAYLLDLFEDIVKRGQGLGAINNSKSSKQYANYLLTSYQGLQILKSFPENDYKLQNVIYDIISVIE
ncbi:TetR/AcrR family transcriptional regulator [Polaribacter batillariae]|uniref:TetR/AcrR family transcriptional regulator n=1 Tax=Polaribacter batillariae TaxID=2808900 RepID=A0ABX7SX16_9FLAO|nr:TetR/AcrR family transcriptional regulator [Polaribacter batillariae]QTD38018.1 TetR/AcrR family transcriptional regulator [Polaribacter batillariae]